MTDSLIAYCGRAADARAGWGALALMRVVFVSPLCALSSALYFSPTGRFGRTSFATPSVAAWQKCTRSAATRARW